MLKTNHQLLWGGFGYIYVSLVALAVIPIHVEILGAPSFGFLALMVVFQNIFFILDFGKSSFVLLKISEYFDASENNSKLYGLLIITEKKLLRTILVVTVIFAIAFYSYQAGVIESGWGLIGFSKYLPFSLLAIAVRLQSELYRSVIIGSGAVNWITCFNILSATARNLVIIFVAPQFEDRLLAFVVYQLVVSVIEIALLRNYVNNILHTVDACECENNFLYVESRNEFLGNMTWISIIWLIVSQLDKIFLSSYMSLYDFGVFSQIILLSSLIVVFSSAFSAFLPSRLAQLGGYETQNGFTFFLWASAWGSCILISLSASLIINAEAILKYWIVEGALKYQTGVFSLYVAGNCFMALGAFWFYVQYAAGDVSMHLKGMIFYAIFYIALLCILMPLHNVLSAAISWCAVNMIYVLFWIPIFGFKNRAYRVILLNCYLPLILISIGAGLILYCIDMSMDGFWGVLICMGISFLYIFTTLAVFLFRANKAMLIRNCRF